MLTDKPQMFALKSSVFRNFIRDWGPHIMSMKKRYSSEKTHEHWRIYWWGLEIDQSPSILPINIFNPMHGFSVTDLAKIPLGSR